MTGPGRALSFDLDGYAQILAAARAAGYAPAPLRAAEAPAERPVMLLRHDVDVSLSLALRMAQQEAELDVQSSYFILLYNDRYNPLSPAGRAAIRGIASLGHEIGLHWDSTLYPNDEAGLAAAFRRDVDLLSEIVGTQIVSASQHDPIGSRRPDVTGLIAFEAYSEAITGRFTYVSDSSMQWRQFTPLDLIDRGVDIQFLSHPVWWVAPGGTQRERLMHAAQETSGDVVDAGRAFADYIEHCLGIRSELDREFQQSR